MADEGEFIGILAAAEMVQVGFQVKNAGMLGDAKGGKQGGAKIAAWNIAENAPAG